MRHTEDYEPDISRRHESGDLPLKPVLKSVGWFFGFTLAAILATIVIFRIMVPGGFGSSFQPSDLQRRLPPEPLPKLQSNMTAKRAIADMRQDESATLNSYATKEGSDKVRIPITRAMEIVSKEGLPTWKAAPAPPPVSGGNP